MPQLVWQEGREPCHHAGGAVSRQGQSLHQAARSALPL
jgi:hypothetical protein